MHIFGFWRYLLKQVRGSIAKSFDEFFPLLKQEANACYGPVRLAASEQHIAENSQAFHEHNLFICGSFFPRQEHLCELRSHYFGHFHSTIQNIPLKLNERLGGVVHSKHVSMVRYTSHLLMPWYLRLFLISW